MEITSEKKKQQPSASSKVIFSKIKAIRKSLADLFQSIPGCPDEIQGVLFATIKNLQSHVSSLSEEFTQCRQSKKAFKESRELDVLPNDPKEG